MPIRIERNICADLDSALSREWLETNGLGGFSSSTITGMNTRRYHGLLTAATKPPVGRLLLLAKLEETLLIGDKRYDLSVNRYPGAVHPQGHRFLKEFRLDPSPFATITAQRIATTRSIRPWNQNRGWPPLRPIRTCPRCTLRTTHRTCARRAIGTTTLNTTWNASEASIFRRISSTPS